MEKDSILDDTQEVNNYSKKSSTPEWTLYGEKIIINSQNILPYAPSKIEELKEHYIFDDKIYSSALAMSTIHLVKDHDGKKYALKEIRKSRLNQPYQFELARNELSIHYSLSKLTDNIVKVYNYYEDDHSYFMLMEYSPKPDYFEELFSDNVNWRIKIAT